MLAAGCISTAAAYGNESNDTSKLSLAKKAFNKSYKFQNDKLLKAYDKSIVSWTKKGKLDKAVVLEEEKQSFLNGYDACGVYDQEPFKEIITRARAFELIAGRWKNSRNGLVVEISKSGRIKCITSPHKRVGIKHIEDNKFSYTGIGGVRLTFLWDEDRMKVVERNVVFKRL